MLTMTVYRQGSTMELTVTVGEQVQSALANEQTQQAASDSQSGGWNGYPFWRKTVKRLLSNGT